MASDKQALKLVLGKQFDADAANKIIAQQKARRPVPTLLPAPPTGGRSEQMDLSNPLGKKLSVERDPYARPIGEDLVMDIADLFAGATFADGLSPDASQAASIGMAATAGLTPGMLAKMGRGVFSKLGQVVRDKFPPSIKSDSLLNLARKHGVKEEEIVTTGLDKLVVPGQRVTREQVEEVVQKGTPQLKTTVLAPRKAGNTAHGRNTKFEQQTLPGGENYRETLITLPDNLDLKALQLEDRELMRAVEDARLSLFSVRDLKGKNSLIYEHAFKKEQALSAEWTKVRKKIAEAGKKDFLGGHFDTPNVLAHARHNDRMTPSGEKVRFLEEVQSDWHQRGKKHGYKTEDRLIDGHDYNWWSVETDRRFDARSPKSGETWSLHQYEDAEKAWQDAIANRNALDGKPHEVPDAPFKDTWEDLVLKQQLTDASEKGLDGVAWTPGRVQADRYNLAKHVKEVHYNPDYMELVAVGHNGETVIKQQSVSPDQLADYIGKEAAERLMLPQNRKFGGSGVNKDYSLTGLDLQVGGEGMLEAYDKRLPAKMEKLLKLFGGKVEQGSVMGAPPQPIIETINTQRGSPWALQGQQGRNNYMPHVNWQGVVNEQQVATFNDPTAAAAWANASPQAVPPAIDAWLARLTPEMRQQILEKGFPMFALMMALQGQTGQTPTAGQQNALQNVLGRGQ